MIGTMKLDDLEAAEAYIRVVRRWLKQGNMERLRLVTHREIALVDAGISPKRAAMLVDEAAAALRVSVPAG